MFLFSLQPLSETFFISRGAEQDISPVIKQRNCINCKKILIIFWGVGGGMGVENKVKPNRDVLVAAVFVSD